MIVHGKIRRSWKILQEHGDIEKIVEFSQTPEDPEGVTRLTISTALRTGRMSEKTFEVIQKFYRAKSRQNDEFVKNNVIPVENDIN